MNNPLRPARGFYLNISEAEEYLRRLASRGQLLEDQARSVDVAMVRRMVALAQGLAPKDTGVLVKGIGGGRSRTDSGTIFFAYAKKTRANGKESANYAPFVERGTRPGERGRINRAQGYFSFAQKLRNEKSRRTHPGTRPRPFFFPAAATVLTGRNAAQIGAAVKLLRDGTPLIARLGR